MKRIQVVPTWSFRDSAGNQLNPQLFLLLREIYETGKLTKATERMGISYRHGWNLLNTWSAFFGLPLVALQKGKGAKLTALGEKLLWAEQRVVARLEPQLDSLASELNLELHRALEGVTPLLRLHASHGYAVALLPDFAESLQLDLQYKSAEAALASLNRGSCDVAGFHLPTDHINKHLEQVYSRYLRPRVHKIIRFTTRRQGLIVKRGNPAGIEKVADLTREEIRFINRQQDSGTRALFDNLLQEQGIENNRIRGYDNEEFTHSAVAAHVAADMADVGMGVEAAADQFGLGFVPLAQEHYLFVCHHKTMQQEAFQRLLEIMRSTEFQSTVKDLAGYTPERCGDVISVADLFA